MRSPILHVMVFFCVWPVFIASLALAEKPAPPPVGGEILWRYEIPSDVSGRFIGVGSDGRIYTTSFSPGALYALTPQGSLIWSLDLGAASSHWPISFAGDGTIYTGAVGVRAVNPDGTLRWTFDPGAWILSGPNVGPDGNIYAADDVRTGGLGFFSLDPAGTLRWSNPGDPLVSGLTSDNDEIVFGDDRLFGGIHFRRSGPWIHTYAFDFDGVQLWDRSYTGDGGPSSNPRRLPDGRLTVRWRDGLLAALHPGGADDWVEPHPDGAQRLFPPAVGSDGTIYAGDEFGVQLWAVNPDGTTRWVRTGDLYESLMSLGVSPGNRVLVVSGWTYNETGWIRGHDTENGDLLWEVILEPEQDLGQLTRTARPAFSSSGDTVYLTTWFVGDGVGHSYLYAISLTERTVAVRGNGPTGAEKMTMSFSPNPCTGPGEIVLRAGSSGSTSIQILDVAGREVRRLFNGPIPGRELHLVWDLHDEEGRLVDSGVYFVKAQTAVGATTTRVVVTR